MPALGVVGGRPDGGGRGRGPGLFTGLRVGLATARAIAAARAIPALGVNSLEALAHACRRRAGLVVPMVDARRGEVYWAMYRCDGAAVEELRPPAVVSPDALAAELTGAAEPALAVGDGAWRYRDQLRAAGADVGDEGEMWPSALAVAELAAARLVGACHRWPRPSRASLPAAARCPDRLGGSGRARHRALQFPVRSGRPRGRPPPFWHRAGVVPLRRPKSPSWPHESGRPEVGSREVATEPMRRRHLPAVMRIERRAHPKPWSLGVFTSELAQGDARYYIVLKVEEKWRATAASCSRRTRLT